MEVPSPIVHRRRILTNPAAEFVERRVDIEVHSQSAEGVEDLEQSSEFVPELDGFVRKGVVFDVSKCYEQSKERRERFRRTFESFVSLLKDRHVDTGLGIELKDPADFTFGYILGILNKIVEEKENFLHTKSCKAFVRKCYRKAEENTGVIEGILNMIPDDIYGSAISGGVALILAAVERHTKRREEIHKFLAEIPEKLEKIHRLSEIHYDSVRIHSCADSILVSIFVVLERIMNSLTKSRKKNLLKPLQVLFQDKSKEQNLTIAMGNAVYDEDERTKTVPDALRVLQDNIDLFQSEIDVAMHERMCIIKQDTDTVRLGQEVQSEKLAWMERSLYWIQERLKSPEDLDLILRNQLYRLLRSNPHLNKSTGQIDSEEMKQSHLEQLAVSKRGLQESNHRVSSRWLAELDGFNYDSMTDIKDCLEHIERLEIDGKNVSESIMSSDELHRWLTSEKSIVLEVDLQTPPSDLNNPLSFASALLAITLRSTEGFPTLAFFCMHRNIESSKDKHSGPIAMVNCFNGQLQDFINRSRPFADLSKLETEPYFRKSKKKLADGLALLKGLLSLLPKHDTVFVILDSLSRLSGDEKDALKVIRALRSIKRHIKHICVKVIITDPLVGSLVEGFVDESLHIQDYVCGAGTIDVDESAHKITTALKDGQTTEEKDVF